MLSTRNVGFLGVCVECEGFISVLPDQGHCHTMLSLEGPTPVMNPGQVISKGHWDNVKYLGIDPCCWVSKYVDGKLSKVVSAHMFCRKLWDLTKQPNGETAHKGEGAQRGSTGPQEKMARLGIEPRTNWIYIPGALTTTELHGPEYRCWLHVTLL